MSHYEVSPREKEDEARRDNYDFDPQELEDEQQRDTIMRQGDNGGE